VVFTIFEQVRKFRVGPGSAICGHWPALSGGHLNAGSAPDTGHSGKNSIRQVIGHKTAVRAHPKA
jgi:hypothetical protein